MEMTMAYSNFVFDGGDAYGNTLFSTSTTISEHYDDKSVSNPASEIASLASCPALPLCPRCKLSGRMDVFLQRDVGQDYFSYGCNRCGNSSHENPRYRCVRCNYDECPSCAEDNDYPDLVSACKCSACSLTKAAIKKDNLNVRFCRLLLKLKSA
jgi:hypothetical protein